MPTHILPLPIHSYACYYLIINLPSNPFNQNVNESVNIGRPFRRSITIKSSLFWHSLQFYQITNYQIYITFWQIDVARIFIFEMYDYICIILVKFPGLRFFFFEFFFRLLLREGKTRGSLRPIQHPNSISEWKYKPLFQFLWAGTLFFSQTYTQTHAHATIRLNWIDKKKGKSFFYVHFCASFYFKWTWCWFSKNRQRFFFFEIT